MQGPRNAGQLHQSVHRTTSAGTGKTRFYQMRFERAWNHSLTSAGNTTLFRGVRELKWNHPRWCGEYV